MFIVGALQCCMLQCPIYGGEDSSDQKRGLCKDDGCFEAA